MIFTDAEISPSPLSRTNAVTPEPLRRCVQCGALVYLSQRCRYIGILHPAPAYTIHEETP